MKAFYTVLCLLAVMVGAVTVNYFYISRLSRELINDVEQLAPPSSENGTALQVKSIREKWARNRRFVQITVNHTEIEVISNATDELCIYAEHQALMEFERARSLLINSLEELELSEKLSPTNIL